MSVERCNHPPAFIQLKDHGMTAHCSACGTGNPIDRNLVKMLMADRRSLAGNPEEYGPTIQMVLMQAARLNAATRSVARAFWRDAKSKQQEDALKLARSAIEGFLNEEPALAGMLNALVATFGQAEIASVREPTK